MRSDQGAGAGVPLPASVASNVSEQWIEGIPIVEETLDRVVTEAASGEKTRSNATGIADRRKAKEESVVMKAVVQSPRVQIQQRQVLELPIMQQRLQKKSQTVQTFVDHIGGQMRMTVYLDPPATDEQIQAAQVRQVRPDSLVVTIGKQQIGYRLPPGWAR
jgi:hypothetical protein